jgi:uncharacterized membrane protein
MTHVTLRAVHLIGLALWFGSLLLVSRLLKAHADAPDAARSSLLQVARRTQLGFGLPGMIMTVGAGLKMLHDLPHYLELGGIHAMLGGTVVAVGIEVALFVLVRRAATTPVSPRVAMALHGTAGLVLLVVVIAAERSLRG